MKLSSTSTILLLTSIIAYAAPVPIVPRAESDAHISYVGRRTRAAIGELYEPREALGLLSPDGVQFKREDMYEDLYTRRSEDYYAPREALDLDASVSTRSMTVIDDDVTELSTRFFEDDDHISVRSPAGDLDLVTRSGMNGVNSEALDMLSRTTHHGHGQRGVDAARVLTRRSREVETRQALRSFVRRSVKKVWNGVKNVIGRVAGMFGF